MGTDDATVTYDRKSGTITISGIGSLAIGKFSVKGNAKFFLDEFAKSTGQAQSGQAIFRAPLVQFADQPDVMQGVFMGQIAFDINGKSCALQANVLGIEQVYLVKGNAFATENDKMTKSEIQHLFIKSSEPKKQAAQGTLKN